ncbi:hypothetical protein GT037_011121 [Alternaria burnsii]|uniref:Uncharacterized protein n=1 Tax=Alternaria burnsii TaxID=1187904 RepID=A0A8H7EAW3_9PLEO|nr:uncharacterized protein GT037_011121 [Alternaria burnsii]KAF7670828.1 hypothetical protein GT037_011121 [Alternaria burnsii]
MRYFAYPFLVQGNAYSRITESRRNDITIGLQSSERISSRTSRQSPTKKSDDTYIQRIEEKLASTVDKPAPKCGDFERAICKKLKELAKKTFQAFCKKPKNTIQATNPEHKANA